MHFLWLLNWSIVWPVGCSIVILFISINIVKYLIDDNSVPIRDFNKRHNWQPLKPMAHASYCSVCESLLLTTLSFYCDCCGVCADKQCVKKADLILKCKEIISSAEDTMKHHWVKGNLPTNEDCTVCFEECSVDPGLVDLHCCWCQRNVHENCVAQLDIECDFGPFKLMIIPPNSVVANNISRMNRRIKLKDIKPTNWPGWSPLIVVANAKSGSSDADNILSTFRSVLNPIQVMTVSSQKSPKNALLWAKLVAPNVCRILVAGGDGTVAWVLNAINELDLDPPPVVAILPLGTGNDLSRSLGWGPEPPEPLCPSEIMQKIQNAETIQLDRWRVDICGYGIRSTKKSFMMYNYLSIGVDANVTLNFHNARESKFYVISSRVINKLIYFGFGTQQVMAPSNRGLEQRLELTMDGMRVELPPLESIVLLNIPCWGAGVRLWDLGGPDGPQQSCSDGLLEVLGIFSSFHIAQLQVGMSQPLRIGQARSIQIKLAGSVPVQIDGEPWSQPPAIIKVIHCGMTSVLQAGQ